MNHLLLTEKCLDTTFKRLFEAESLPGDNEEFIKSEEEIILRNMLQAHINAINR